MSLVRAILICSWLGQISCAHVGQTSRETGRLWVPVTGSAPVADGDANQDEHIIPVRIAKIKNSHDSTCWQRCGERERLLHCWWDCKLVQSLWKSIWQFLRKLEIVLPEDPVILLEVIYPKDSPTCNKDRCCAMFIATSFVIARNWKQLKCPSMEEWIQKM